MLYKMSKICHFQLWVKKCYCAADRLLFHSVGTESVQNRFWKYFQNSNECYETTFLVFQRLQGFFCFIFLGKSDA